MPGLSERGLGPCSLAQIAGLAAAMEESNNSLPGGRIAQPG